MVGSMQKSQAKSAWLPLPRSPSSRRRRSAATRRFCSHRTGAKSGKPCARGALGDDAAVRVRSGQLVRGSGSCCGWRLPPCVGHGPASAGVGRAVDRTLERGRPSMGQSEKLAVIGPATRDAGGEFVALRRDLRGCRGRAGRQRTMVLMIVPSGARQTILVGKPSLGRRWRGLRRMKTLLIARVVSGPRG